MDEEVITRLMALATHRSATVATAAIYALGESAPTATHIIKLLLDITESNSAERVSAAAKALGRIFRNR
ncbi:HEAT repeat domain-containing protein [Tatumella punctata]|uniref:HEAT repeat domain-containing protein n=1 Tax=Tatumella punctata TaxID=399969 RepID=A0ABW1VLY0_9GAMM